MTEASNDSEDRRHFLKTHGLKIIVFLHVTFWTLIPALTHRNAPLDVVEGFAWGREWQLGSYKHPPLQSWLLEISGMIFGTSGVGYFGLAALCGGIALWAVYKTAELVTDKTTALLATALTQSILYFTFLSPEFNPNTLQLLFWALAACAFAHALILKSTRYWILLGIIFAAGFYAKYFMAVCGVSFGLFMIVDKESRRWFLRPQPYAALLTCALLCAPHLSWLQANNYLPFTYAASRLETTNGFLRAAQVTLTFVGGQIAALLLTLILGTWLLSPLTRSQGRHASLIRWLAFCPLVLIVIPSFITGQGLRSMWGVPILTLVPLWLVSRYQRRSEKFRTFVIAWVGVFFLVLFAYAGNQMFASRLGFKPSRGQYPGREAAQYFNGIWREKTSKPLIYVVGEAWEACNVAFYSPTQPRPHVWIYGSEAVNPWISEPDVLKQGAVLVWKATDSRPPGWVDVFASRFPGTMIQTNHVFANGTGKDATPVVVGSAILLPQP